MKSNTGKKEKPRKKAKSAECNDRHCPFHGSISLRGRSFVQKVISTSPQRTATVEMERRAYIPKYERYEKKRTRLHAHNPDCISASVGDKVRIMECRPISKTKHFVITEKIS